MRQPTLHIAIEAAHAAGEIIRRSWRRLESIPVAKKARHDYVSEVDQNCEATIVREIRRFHPEHAFLCEESGQHGEGDTVWIIDPLDGTSNFLHGIPHFAVAIAQRVKGRLENAVVYDPMRDETFTASRGKGAYLDKQRLRVSERKTLDTAIIATAFPFRQRQFMPAYTRMFSAVFRQVEDIRRSGSAALDLAWTAAGRLDGYFEIGLQPWDVAAGALLVREAGGVVTDFLGEDQVEVEDAGTLIAAPYKLVTPLRQLIQPHWAPKKAAATAEGSPQQDTP